MADKGKLGTAKAQFEAMQPSARLSDRVADALAAEIRTGGLAVGGKIPTEARLAEQFNVSRTVVREALSHLRSLGLIDVRQGSGAFVREQGFSPLNFDAGSSASKQAVMQIVEVRRALESEAAGLAAMRRSARHLARLKAAVRALDKAVRNGGDGVEEDVNFHRAIADASQNPFLLKTLDYLQQFLKGATRVTRANEARHGQWMQQVVEEHRAVVNAIERGDPHLARAAAASHMDNAQRRIEEADPRFWHSEGVKLAAPLTRPE